MRLGWRQCRLVFQRGGCLADAASAPRWISWWRVCARVRAGRWCCAGGRSRQERAAGVSGAARVRVRHCPGGWRRVGDGARVRGVAAAVRNVPRSPGAPSRPAARCAWHCVRFARRRRAGPVPRRPGGAESAVGHCGKATARLHRGRRRSGSTRPPRRRWPSLRAVSVRSRSGWSSLCASRAASGILRACRSSPWAG
jgi:hypothetical protein